MGSTHTPFERLTAIHPNRLIKIETGPTPIVPRLIDLFIWLSFGWRSMVVAAPKADKVAILYLLFSFTNLCTNFSDKNYLEQLDASKLV